MFRTMMSMILCCIAAVSIARADAIKESVEFDIGAQKLDTALLEFSRQAKVQVLTDTDAVKSVDAPAVKGRMMPTAAMQRLLEGTALKFQVMSENAIAVRHGSKSQAQNQINPSDQMTLAQNAGNTGTVTTGPEGALNNSSNRTDEQNTPQSSDAQDNSKLQEVVVIGTNIRGVYPASSPVQTYTAEDIARTGATTTAQFVGKLTQNLASKVVYGSTGANPEAVTGIDLRGLGVGTTLVLINGRRFALADRGQTADVSVIPASAIERIEVLTEGASALYGSDAIGGVVNFVLRKDFQGAETRLSYGEARGGGMSQTNFTQTLGTQWGSGHGLLSYDYFDATGLDRTERSYSAPIAPGTLTPGEKRHSALVTLSQDLGERLVVSGDVAMTWRDTDYARSNVTSTNPLNRTRIGISNDTEQLFADVGLDYAFGNTLHASLLTSYSENNTDTHSITTRFNNPSFPATISDRAKSFSALDITAKLDGPLFTAPGGGEVKFSLGAGMLDEEYNGEAVTTLASPNKIGRRTAYAFAEIFAPLIVPSHNVPLVHRLELSLAARYTNYEDRSRPSLNRDFGDAVDPKVGLLWAPISQLALRATYGESFRTPSLLQLDPFSSARVQFFEEINIPDPSGPVSLIMDVLGVAPDLDAETAQTFTAGFDYRPETHPGLKISATYYTIDYDERIANPVLDPNLLAQPNLQPDIFFRGASAAYIEEALRKAEIIFDAPVSLNLSNLTAAAATLAANPNLWIIDDRLRNLSVSTQKGYDATIDDSIDTRWGQFRLGGQVTYIRTYDQQNSPSNPLIAVIDRDGFPVSLRGRVYSGLSHGAFDGTLSLNYVDDYVNIRGSTAPVPIESWKTIDLNVGYDFGAGGRKGILTGLRASLSIQNLFDKDPPFVQWWVPADRIGFDPTNANPLGRLIVVGASKQW